MKLTKTVQGNKLTAYVAGRLDTLSAPEFDAEMKSSLDGINELVLDFAELEYVSSPGLRVLLSLHKLMAGKGSMKVIHVNEIVNEVFEVTRFCDIFNIE